ncbi:hypothetical protein HD806DRAFT_7225 [Xylariaceae sp. AK1471]|nr:hypothetical protein HD806DRAFT_7225 [Xylariaceae sp. AK1471]
MATLTPAQLELASSLTQDELPTKLRCAICSKLAVNAFRLPCCETAICDSCQATLPSSCPVCEHTPVSGADCTVYKSLRTTIRVFLKTEEKKREAARPKTNGSTPTTPVQVTPIPTPTQAQAPADLPATEPPVPERTNSEHSLDATVAVADSSVETENKTVTDESINNQPDAAKADSHPPEEQHAETEEAEGPGPQGHVTEETAGGDGEKDDAVAEVSADQSEQSGMNFGFDPMNNNFNMNFGNGDMTQMQMMMAMQNGMNPAAFGSFPMMGMMDPMMMQNMMMSGGFGAQGMGMNGMNMNMGMNGFNGGGDDWNGQQSWNVGQDNFNPNAAGMGNGDFGNFNANFRTGNYGHQNQFNDYRRGNYGFRGRGRGRGYYGGYGRGYHHSYNNQGTAWAEGQSNSTPQPVDTTSGTGNVDEFGRTIRADQSHDGQPVGQDGQNTVAAQEDNGASEAQNQVVKELVPGSDETQGDNTNPDGDVSTLHRPANGTRSLDSVPPQQIAPDVPLNAPTGPKAMRQGLPNTSLHHLRARGYIMDERTPNLGTNGPVVASPVEKSRSSSLQSRKDKDRRQHDRHQERDVDEKDRAKEHDRGRARSRTHSISRSRTPTRSRSRDRKESRRHRRHRSPSVSGDSRDGDHRRRKHRSKRHSTRDDDDHKGRSRGDKHEERSRSASPAEREHKRSSHRSHRDRDRDRDRDEKRRERDKDRGRDSDHDRHRKSSHRTSHRDRDEERERDREREKDRDRARDKDRSRELDKEHRNHDSKSTTAGPPTPVEPSEKGFNPPTGPRGSFSIKGAGSKPSLEIRGASSRPSDLQRRESETSRRASQSSATGGQKSIPSASGKDPHTLEREARDRERLLKEAQRIAGMTGLAGRSSGKRNREAGDDRSGRRKSRRSETVSMDDEARMRRIEAEREGRRWD